MVCHGARERRWEGVELICVSFGTWLKRFTVVFLTAARINKLMQDTIMYTIDGSVIGFQ